MKLLDVYHRLPYPARCLAASLRGLYLNRWRYSAATPQLVLEALERESWTPDDWRRHQSEALSAQLERAALRVPYYRDYWRRQHHDDWRDLHAWPLLRKETLRQDPQAFLVDGTDPRRLFPEHTSGSTGTPLAVWWSRSTAISWYALVEARMRRWHGVDKNDRWAILGGQLVTRAAARRPPYWVWNAASHQLYLSSYHLAPVTVAAYLDAMRQHRVRYLMGYPSAMAALARLAEEQGIEAPDLRVVLSNAEPLFASQRTILERVFHCPARDSYGTAELACGASECESGKLHLWPEVAVVEVLSDDDVAALPGTPGRLVTTGLLNADMPLIRYEVGDLAVVAAPEEECACGRRLPLLASLEGRVDDVIITPEGRRVGRLDPVFKADLPIREAQIVQEELTRVEMLVVPSAGYGPRTAAELTKRLADRLGPSMQIEIRQVTHLERGKAGKLRAVVSKISQDDVP